MLGCFPSPSLKKEVAAHRGVVNLEQLQRNKVWFILLEGPTDGICHGVSVFSVIMMVRWLSAIHTHTYTRVHAYPSWTIFGLHTHVLRCTPSPTDGTCLLGRGRPEHHSISLPGVGAGRQERTVRAEERLRQTFAARIRQLTHPCNVHRCVPPGPTRPACPHLRARPLFFSGIHPKSTENPAKISTDFSPPEGRVLTDLLHTHGGGVAAPTHPTTLIKLPNGVGAGRRPNPLLLVARVRASEGGVFPPAGSRCGTRHVDAASWQS